MTKKDQLEPSTSGAATSTALPDDAQSDKRDVFEESLIGLPEKYRDEILRQYNLPETKASLLSILRFATWKETTLMVVGSVTSAAAGKPHFGGSLMSGAALPLMTVVFGNLTNVFGGFGSPNGAAVDPIQSVDDFNSQISKLALQFVFIGIGVMGASFIGTLAWTMSGERISRRIRGYPLQVSY